MKFDRIQMS